MPHVFRDLAVFLECSSLQRDMKEKFGSFRGCHVQQALSRPIPSHPPVSFGGGSRSKIIEELKNHSFSTFCKKNGAIFIAVLKKDVHVRFGDG